MTIAHGYIIVQRKWDEETKLSAGMHRIAPTVGEAWRRFVGYDRGSEFPIIVQRWNERGYGPHRVEVKLAPLPELPLSDEERTALEDFLKGESK